MGTHAGSVMTLANSIIGVSVLAMPFCFKQCGIILSIVMLLLSNIVTRLACYYLIKSAIMEKRKNFEMLAFRVLGPTGKLVVELCIIGFMLGTCVAFFVVVGDLGPPILAELIGVEHPSALRPSVLIGLGVFVVLPLGLLRNVESLTTLCTASICFYVCLVLKVVGEATSHLLAWDWMDKVTFWRPAGVLQCVPIFSMALSCQMQLFEVFDSLPSTPMDRMYSIVRSAVNMTTSFYVAVGFFGYVAFCNQPFTGNLLINFSPSLVSFVIKFGFVLSVAVSFPLVIFPCRASIYSLIFRRGHIGQSEGSSHIPETKFQCITLLIVTASLVAGLVVPSIEVVLGFVGSTIGVFICIIFPSVIFICLSSKDTNERLLAKMLVGGGLLTMVLSTYANLYTSNEVVLVLNTPIVPILEVPVENNVHEIPPLNKKIIGDETLKKLDVSDLKELLPDIKVVSVPPVKKADPPIEESRKEPPNPVPVEPKEAVKVRPIIIGLNRSEDILAKLEAAVESKKVKVVEKSFKADMNDDSAKLQLNKKQDTVKTNEIKKEENLVVPKEIIEKKEELIKQELKKSVNPAIIAKNEVKMELPKSVELKSEDVVVHQETIEVKNKIPEEKKPELKLIKGSLVENLAQGIPLPLVVKDKMLESKSKTPLPKEREKRDTDVTENRNESLKTAETDDAEKCNKNDTADPDKAGDVVATTIKPFNNVPEPAFGEDLIKTPKYLSDQGLVLDLSVQKNSLDIQPPVVVQIKRDLKSVEEPAIPKKVEHR